MSRYESSTFVHDINVMNVDVLRAACETLGWKYHVDDSNFYVTDVNQEHQLYGEFAIKVDLQTNRATYNTYYLPDANQKVNMLVDAFYAINAEYARTALIQEFKKKGFVYKSNRHFTPNEREIYSFFLEGRSVEKSEDEPIASIKFTVLYDGTIITDSDYLPNDVNERAHAAMDNLEKLLGRKRVMKKKDPSKIPARHLAKMKPRRNKLQSKTSR